MTERRAERKVYYCGRELKPQSLLVIYDYILKPNKTFAETQIIVQGGRF